MQRVHEKPNVLTFCHYKKRTMPVEGDSSENEENNDHEESADEIQEPPFMSNFYELFKLSFVYTRLKLARA